MERLPPTMSGVQLTGHGGPERLVWRDDLPVPVPRPGQALVRVLAAGVNNTDINTRLGWYAPQVTGATGDGVVGQDGGWAGALDFPRIQGGDLCGRVVALGLDANPVWLGRRVTCPINQPEPTLADPLALRVPGSDYDGAFAQFCVVPVRHLHDVSASSLGDIEIGAMPCAYGTALNMLTRAGVVAGVAAGVVAGVAAGRRVLITGASGGVGLAAVQLAAQAGAQVTAVTDPAKAAVVRAAGAALTLGRDDALPEGFDAVLDVVGGPGWAAQLGALRPGGHYAVSGAIAGPMVSMDLRRLYLHDLTIHGCTHQPPAVFATLVALINAAVLRPVIAATYPLRDIALAQADFLSKRHPGKIVLLPPEPSA